jgi:hypothetical protein
LHRLIAPAFAGAFHYSIITCDPSLASSTLGVAPSPSDVVAAAKRFATDPSLANVKSPNDCCFIAQDVAAAGGATLGDATESNIPADNQAGGYWRVAYRGSDPGAIQNWSSLVQPGDILRIGWEGGGDHSFTVVAVNPTANSDGSHNLRVYDNATTYELIQLHWDTNDGLNTLNESWTYDAKGASDPTTVTIYRLTPDHLYLIQGSNTGSWLAGNGLNDDIVGGAGNDCLVGGAGNNVLDGGGGTNTAVFFGPRSEYDITSYTSLQDGLVHTVVSDTGSAGDGTDDLVRIQELQFSDWTYALSGSELTPLHPNFTNSISTPLASGPLDSVNLGSTVPGASIIPQINPMPIVTAGGVVLPGGTAGGGDLLAAAAGAFSAAPSNPAETGSLLSSSNSGLERLVQTIASFGAESAVIDAGSAWEPGHLGVNGFLAASGS